MPEGGGSIPVKVVNVYLYYVVPNFGLVGGVIRVGLLQVPLPFSLVGLNVSSPYLSTFLKFSYIELMKNKRSLLM